LESLSIANRRSWISASRFWSETIGKHCGQVCSSIFGGLFLHRILWSRNILWEIFGPTWPCIVDDAFHQILELGRAYAIPWFCFRKSVISVFLSGWLFMLLRTGIQQKMDVSGGSMLPGNRFITLSIRQFNNISSFRD
jgi:hypothetical protein